MNHHWRSNKLLLILALGALALVFAACAVKQPVSLGPPTAPPPQPYEGPVTIEALRNAIAFRGAGSMVAEVKVKVSATGRRGGRFKGLIAYEYPGKLRLRLFGPMGGTVLDALHTVGGLLQLYPSGRGNLYEGLTPAALLMGDVQYTMAEVEGSYMLYARVPGEDGPELVASYAFDRKSLLNTEMVLYNGSKRFLSVGYGNFSNRTPHRAMVRLESGYRLDVELIEPALGDELEQALFRPLSANGMRVLPLNMLMNKNGLINESGTETPY